MEIRQAEPDDATTLARVLQSVSWLWASTWGEAQLAEAARRFLEAGSQAPGTTVLVAEADGEGLGFVALHLFPSIRDGCEGYVSHLFVHDAARGKGVGRRLLAAAEETAKEQGCGQLMLYINRPRPAYQRGFYEQAGWQEKETAALFFRGLGSS